MLPCATLRPLDTVLLGRYPKFVVLNAQHNFVPYLDTEGFPERRRNDDTTVLVNSQPGFPIHDITPR
jgi:hypothetical protein